jgi:type I restriction enzyme S subunit
VPKLADVAEINPRFDRSESNDLSEVISFVPMANVSDVLGAITSEEHRELGDVIKGFTTFKDRDVLVAKITPCFENGKIAHARIDKRLGFGSTEFHVVRPATEKLDDRYLYHFLRQPVVREAGKLRMTGSGGQKRVPKTFIEELEIPLPPLPEQRRIAAILDKADALRAKRREAIAKLDQLLQSVFMEMFGDPVTNPKGYPLGTLGEFIAVGPTNGISKPKDYFGHGVPILDNKAVYRGMYVDFSDQRLLQVSETELKKLLVIPGDIIFNRVSVKPEGVGVAALALNPPENCIFESNLIRVRLSADLDPVFVIALLRTETSRTHVLKRANVANQASISQGTISSIPVLIPPAEKQKKFSAFVNCLDVQRRRLLAGSQAAENMFSALQYRAFEGNL